MIVMAIGIFIAVSVFLQAMVSGQTNYDIESSDIEQMKFLSNYSKANEVIE